MFIFEREQANQYTTGRAVCQFEGIMDRTMRFVEELQLTDVVLWKRFVEQFRLHTDSDDAGWRGEYWGKMMRGACFVYSYTKNEVLYEILSQTVRDMIESVDQYGRISSYTIEKEFIGWDIWSRKYVMLGMQYFLEICRNEKLAEEITACMCGQADYIMSKIGPKEEGKKPITTATNHWRGLNSVSLLEPIVRLYNLTQEEKYLAFAEYIVSTGGTSVENIFQLALENKLYPYQYPVAKAYEMTSCFEGLLEFYRIKGVEWHKTAIINYANRILESDFTVIGSSGCTHELFDHSTVRQANTTNGKIVQETCVTVTLMKFFYQLTLLTGDSHFVDAFERSLYNAYLGAVNTEKSIEPTIRELYPEAVIEPLPFDSYSPLTAGTRGNGIGGLKLMPDAHYYGCCACIGAAGIGLVPKMALMKYQEGLAVNLYVPGTIQTSTPCGEKTNLTIDTKYPVDGHVRISIDTEAKKAFSICLRNPEWSKETVVQVNGDMIEPNEGYIEITRQWKNGDEIELVLDMRTEAIYPIPYGHQVLMNKVIWGHNYVVPTYDEEDPKAKKHLSLRRGPLTLAVDSRLGRDASEAFDIAVSEDGYVKTSVPEKDVAPYEHMIELEVPMENGTSFRVTDYASAGKLWTEESKMAAWIYTGRARGEEDGTISEK